MATYGKTSAPTTPSTPGDSDFQDIWNYLKWLRKGYDLTSNFTGLPNTRELASKGYDYLTNLGSDASAEAGASASDMAAANAYDSAFSGASGATAGEGAAEGMGAGSWASVLAPLVATWSAYTRGSGRNEPLEKRQETQGAVPLLKNILEGQQVNANDLWSKYKQQPRYAPSADGGASDIIDTSYKPSVLSLIHI